MTHLNAVGTSHLPDLSGAAPRTQAVAPVAAVVAPIEASATAVRTPEDVAAALKQRALRATVIDFRRTLARVTREEDPLIRHIGLRAVSRQTEASGFDPSQLEHLDDQLFVRRLLETVRKDVHRSFARLNEWERADLDALDSCANAEHARREAAARLDSAEAAALALRQSAQAHHRAFSLEMARAAGPLAALANARARSPLLRALGLALVFGGFLSLIVLLARWHHLGSDGPTLAMSGLSALLLFGFGAWLSSDPVGRRARLLNRLQGLADEERASAEASTAAEAELARAMTHCKQTDHEFRRQEAAAVEVLRRRPGLLRCATPGSALEGDEPVAQPAGVELPGAGPGARAEPRFTPEACAV